jgi:hypothetical protein
MISMVREKKELIIKNKIFTKNEVLSLIRLFIKTSNDILDKSKEIKRNDLIHKGCNEQNIKEQYIDASQSSLEFTLSDNSIYNGTIEEFIETDAIPAGKKIVEIDLYFKENVFNSRFIIKIRHSHPFSTSSYVIVEGEDRTWVSGTIGIIEEFLSTCRNQSLIIKKLQVLIIASTDLILMLFLINLIKIFIRTKVIFPKIVGNIFTNELFYFIVLLALISVTPSIFIYKCLKKLYPAVEIQTRKEFNQSEKEKRFKLWIIISLIIIPTILSFMFRLV